MSLVLQSSGGGQITIQEPATASNFTQTLPAATGDVMVSGNMPAFSAYAASAQSYANNSTTKVAFDTKTFDTANCFNTTNYRYTPNVAGYYLFSFNTGFAGPGTYTGSLAMVHNLYKNGGNIEQLAVFSASSGYPQLNTTKLLYMNGTTDYVELYIYTNAIGGATLQGGSSFNHFEGTLVRAA